MSTSILFDEQPVITYKNKRLSRDSNQNKVKHILKCKENILDHKYRKELKRKLKKYKLRHDGQEDPDVLDVSKILVSLLKIKSPNHKEISKNIQVEDELRPKNYLFKMGRRQQILSKTKTISDVSVVNNIDADNVINAPLNRPSKERTDSKRPKVLSNSAVDAIDENDTDLSVTKEIKNKTNAFKLLMDSRNKSIGCNSPGKDKISEESQSEEVLEKKKAKVKRTLLLQKMAEAKGSLKNKELEDHKEKEIQKKMEKRAERLKTLILNCEPKTQPKEKKNNSKDKEPVKKDQSVPKKNKLHLVDLFQVIDVDERKNKLPVSDESTLEDNEFLKKLSPSLKKRENMMCYFKKIEKDEDVKTIGLNEDNDNVLIKVKIAAKSKKKAKKKKLSLSRDVEDNSDLKDTNDTLTCNDDLTENKTRFQNKKENDGNLDNVEKQIKTVDTNKRHANADELRPKRNTKRPAKYIDEVSITSSDEELHIFTPKKKKQSLGKNDIGNKMNNEEPEMTKSKHASVSKKELKTSITTKSKNTEKKQEKKNVNQEKKIVNQEKKVAKLAPIFNTKPNLDAAALEAKQKFLSSGVPDKLKKVIEKQNSKYVYSKTFLPVVHVQQNETFVLLTPNEITSNVLESDEDVHNDSEVQIANFFEKVLDMNKSGFIKKSENSVQLLTDKEVQTVLQGIKETYPKFPVYRTYRLLKDKCKGQYRDSSYLDLDNSIEVINSMIDLNVDNPDRLNWTDKYKPMSSKEIIGNFETTKELKKWLVSWTENESKTKKYNKSDSDSSDFYYSDTDSKDSMKATNNLLILNGPVGSGKTSIVYAVASELAIKVLEVNASSKRTGKIMLQDLQEATQSHKVNRGKSSSQDCSQKLQDVIEVKVTKPKKRGRPKKLQDKPSKKLESVGSQEGSSQSQISQDTTQTCMSLILIDDADIVFDQDDGFCSAIVQLVHCSKRPVILITSSMTCPHLQRFIQSAKILKTRPLLPRMLGTWLDIMCLVENNKWTPGLGTQVLSTFRGDIRKSINYLQFYFPKNNLTANGTDQSNDFSKINAEDESSSMSWSEREVMEERSNTVYGYSKNIKNVSHRVLNDNNSLLHFDCPIQLFKVWWNVPNFLNKQLDNLQDMRTVNKTHLKEATNITAVEALAKTLDAISFAGCFQRHFVTDITDSPWLNLEQNSVSEQEHRSNYNQYDTVADEISHELITGSILNSQKALGLDHNIDLEYPGIEVNRNRDKIRSRHANLTDYLNASASLDRRALALDYWSSCRSICRIEKSKTDTNTRRNNRHFHYLKSLNILCNNDSFENLSESLSVCKTV